jgi:hypothetical protein
MTIQAIGQQRPSRRGMRSIAKVQLSQMGVYRFGIAFTVIAFLDPTTFFWGSSYSGIVKYLYTATALFFIVLYASRYNSIVLRPIAPILALLFFVVTSAVFIFNLISYGYQLSFATAFTSSLIFSCAAFVSLSRTNIDSDRILRQLLYLFLLCAVAYLFETLFKATAFGRAHSYFDDPEFSKSIISLLGLCLAIILRKRAMVLIFLFLLLAALLIRPTSTLIVAMMVALPLTILLRARAILSVRIVASAVLIIAALSPLLLYLFFDQIGSILESFELAVKTGTLGGHSNSHFRLLVLNTALNHLAETSLWFGNGLDGNTTVFIGRELPAWLDVDQLGLVTIHSDFFIVLTQSGLLGYLVFLAFLYSILSSRIRALSQVVRSDTYNLLSLSVIAAVCVIIFSTVNPFIQYYYVLNPIWTLFFVSELMARATVRLIAPA